MMFISYAQNFEDVMLWRALSHVDRGFYIDIGAQDPVIDSVSLAFSERGWTGVSVEPNPQYAERLRQMRPEGFVEQVAIGAESGVATIYIFPDTGLSTASAEIAARHNLSGLTPVGLEVCLISTDELLSKYANRDVHWLKIDVEGFERSVLEGWRQSPVRPWILVIESTEPTTQNLTHENWEHYIFEKGYEFAYFDGLNRFYVHEAHKELLESFKAPPNVFDGFSLAGSSSHSFCDFIKIKLRQTQSDGVGENAVNSRQDAAGTLREEIAPINQRLLEIGMRLERSQAEVENLREEAKGKKEALARLAILQARLAEVEVQREQQSAECNALRQSWSWRVTAPLRWSLDMPAQLARCVRQTVSSGVHHAIRIGHRPLSRVIAWVLRNPERAGRINLWLQRRAPALHRQLRNVAHGTYSVAHLMTASAGASEAAQNSLPPRARQICAALDLAIKRNRGG